MSFTQQQRERSSKKRSRAVPLPTLVLEEPTLHQGATPLITLGNFKNIHMKLEGHNPSGSVKYRLMRAVFKDALASGKFHPGQPVVEITSGNTGVAIAHVVREYGSPVTLLVPQGVSSSLVKRFKEYGCIVKSFSPEQSIEEMFEAAQEFREMGYYWPNQFEDKQGFLTYKSIVQEVVHSIAPVDYFITGVGSGGTIMGIGTELLECYPSTCIVAVEPASFGSIEGLRNTMAIHRGDVDIYDLTFAHKTAYVTKEMATVAQQELLEEHNIIAGQSTGAAYAVAKEYAQEYPQRHILLVSADGVLGDTKKKKPIVVEL